MCQGEVGILEALLKSRKDPGEPAGDPGPRKAPARRGGCWNQIQGDVTP